MKVRDLIDKLECFDPESELLVSIYETSSGSPIDTTADIDFDVVDGSPTLKIDVETDKFKQTVKD